MSMNQPQTQPQSNTLAPNNYYYGNYYGTGNPNDPNNPYSNYGKTPYNNLGFNRNSNNTNNNSTFAMQHPYLATILAMLSPGITGGGLLSSLFSNKDSNGRTIPPEERVFGNI